MKVDSIGNFSRGFGEAQVNESSLSVATSPSQNNASGAKPKKKDALDKFETAIINASDMNDTVNVPRTIFKGYLLFMIGTALGSIGAIVKNKHDKLSKGLNIAGIILATYGTFCFARPYIIKSKEKQ